MKNLLLILLLIHVCLTGWAMQTSWLGISPFNSIWTYQIFSEVMFLSPGFLYGEAKIQGRKMVENISSELESLLRYPRFDLFII